jgi:hypothetical protein
MLQQISNSANKRVTDQSMNLLRNHGSSTKSNSIQQELHEIKIELEKLSNGGNTGSSEWEAKIEGCLNHLQECMKQISPDSLEVKSTVLQDNDSSVTPVPNISSSAFLPQSTTTLQVSPPTPSTGDSKSVLLREAIRMLAEENEPVSLRAGAQLLYLYVMNLSSHPHVPRYRKIFTNESFQKVEWLRGGKELLVAVGFEELQNENRFEWQGGSDDGDVVYLKEAAAALSILKSCSDDNTKQLSSNALSVLRPSTPPPGGLSKLDLQTPIFIASPPTTKKHPLLDESGGEDSILDMSNASEQFQSRLESLAQPVISDDTPIFGIENDSEDTIPQTSLSMRASDKGEVLDEEGGDDFESASEDLKDVNSEKPSSNDESGETAEISS